MNQARSKRGLHSVGCKFIDFAVVVVRRKEILRLRADGNQQECPRTKRSDERRTLSPTFHSQEPFHFLDNTGVSIDAHLCKTALRIVSRINLRQSCNKCQQPCLAQKPIHAPVLEGCAAAYPQARKR